MHENFGLDLTKDEDVKLAGEMAGTLFMFSGIVGAFVQGGPIGKIVKSLGERRLIAISLFITAFSLAMIPFVHGDVHVNGKLSWSALFSSQGGPWWMLLGVLAALAIGSGLTRPPLFGLLSILTPSHEQGMTIGIAQSAGSLARIVGPMFVGYVFAKHHVLPYMVCAAISLVTGVIAVIGLLLRKNK